MKRVEVDIEEPFRGFVSEYSRMHGCSMPQAYADLMAIGLQVIGESDKYRTAQTKKPINAEIEVSQDENRNDTVHVVIYE